MVENGSFISSGDSSNIGRDAKSTKIFWSYSPILPNRERQRLDKSQGPLGRNDESHSGIDSVTGATFEMERLQLGNDLERIHLPVHHHQMSRFYFGNELFNMKHFLGNVALAQAIMPVRCARMNSVFLFFFSVVSVMIARIDLAYPSLFRMSVKRASTVISRLPLVWFCSSPCHPPCSRIKALISASRNLDK